MPEWVLSRATVVSLALIGGLLSLLASWYQARATVSPQTLLWLNKAAYTFMAVSIALFIAAGLLGGDT